MLICSKIRLFDILFCYLSSSHTKLWINWSSSIHPCSQTLRCYCDTNKWELWRPTFPCYLLFAYYIQKAQWYKILTSLVAVITWAIFYLKLALCLTEEPYEIPLQKILHETVYRVSRKTSFPLALYFSQVFSTYLQTFSWFTLCIFSKTFYVTHHH